MPRFDAFGDVLEVTRVDGRWQVRRLGHGVAAPAPDVQIPAEIAEQDLARFLEDPFHESGGPGATVRRLD